MVWKTPKDWTNKTRILKCFAFLPTPLDNGKTIWLESYFEIGIHEVGYDDYGWRVMRRYQQKEK